MAVVEKGIGGNDINYYWKINHMYDNLIDSQKLSDRRINKGEENDNCFFGYYGAGSGGVPEKGRGA
jgi:hypothetical protein